MAEIAGSAAAPVCDLLRWDLHQTLPKLLLQGLVAPPGGRGNRPSPFASRNDAAVHPASPSPYRTVTCASVALLLRPPRLTDDVDLPPEGACGRRLRSAAARGPGRRVLVDARRNRNRGVDAPSVDGSVVGRPDNATARQLTSSTPAEPR